MLIVQFLLTVMTLGLFAGFAGLFWLIGKRSTALERELAELRSDMARLIGSGEDGELTVMLRHLHEAQKRTDEQLAVRRQQDERYAALSDESRWERDWKRAFESDR